MPPRYRRVAVIGAGPSGLAAVRALAAEKVFDTIRVFDRRDQVGGLWHYDPVPDVFPETTGVPTDQTLAAPPTLPTFAPPAPQDPRARSALYWDLDTNVGNKAMEYTHTPFPVVNSPVSIERYGHNNPSRPYTAIKDYLEDLFLPHQSLVSLKTTVEKVEKVDNGQWALTLRKAGETYRGQTHDYWWSETFDAVVVASGHYNVPLIPDIPGLIETSKQFPGRFEHSKSYRKAEKYVNKRVLVVGGNASASDFLQDLHRIVKGPLEVSIRGRNPAIESVYDLPNLNTRTTIKSIAPTADGKSFDVVFDDNTTLSGLDHVLFATGYRLQYPFLHPNPTTPENHVAGFYQHVFNTADPSLTLVGQVKAGLSFRVYEYQAVAIARFYAGRNALSLPSADEQRQWEQDRIKTFGAAYGFHTIGPDLYEPYFNWLADFAGPPDADSESYALPRWQNVWAEDGIAVLKLKGKHWKELIARSTPGIKAKL